MNEKNFSDGKRGRTALTEERRALLLTAMAQAAALEKVTDDEISDLTSSATQFASQLVIGIHLATATQAGVETMYRNMLAEAQAIFGEKAAEELRQSLIRRGAK